MLQTYGTSLAAALAASLASGVMVACVDALGAGGGALVLALALYLPPCLAAGVALGLFAGAWRASFGEAALSRVIKRLRLDADLDRAVCGAVIAAAVVAVIYVLFVALLSLKLVGSVERKSVGALLLGAVSATALPVFVAAGLPVFRVGRWIARAVPRLGPMPASGILVLVGSVAGGGAGLVFVRARLDWRALDLGWLVMGVLWGIGLVSWLVIWYRLLGSVRRRLPVRGLLAGVAAASAIALPAVVLSGQPSEDAVRDLVDDTSGARFLLGVARGFSDGDGDGHSAFLGGPDCDDGNPAVHPDAPEVPGNGIDDNCLNGDAEAVDNTQLQTDNGDDNGLPELSFRGNVLIIAVDTVRADRLGIAGYRRDDYPKSLTPRIDAFAQSASYFSRIYAQAPNTPRSFPSLFASLYPSQVKVSKPFANYADVLDENVLLFEQLKAAGLHTVGISSHFYFDKAPGIRQGFSEYDNAGALNIAGSNKDTSSPRIVPRAVHRLRALADEDRRFAMFVHLFEPHSTYMKHDGFTYDKTKTASLVQKYDYEIAYVDGWVGKILDALEATGLDKTTMVVVVSDHGEAFGTHRFAGKRMFFHGQTLYDELLRVPLIIRLPGVEPTHIEAPAALIDVAPTVLAALGIDRPPSFRGRNLLPAMRGVPLPQRPVFAELLPAPSWNHSARAMVTGDGKHKVIYRISDKKTEIYDLEADPQEQTDLSSKNASLANTLRKELLEWVEVGLQ